jgi:hypothetical protein
MDRTREDMTDAQLRTAALCARVLRLAGKAPVWHFNDCGCCVCVHEDVPRVHAGYIVNRSGDAFWETAADG